MMQFFFNLRRHDLTFFFPFYQSNVISEQILIHFSYHFFTSKDKKLLNSLMKCHDTELSEGAKNDIGVRVMYMFNVARATQNEQRVEDHSWVREIDWFSIYDELSCLFFFLPFRLDCTQSLPDPIEKQFTLRLSGNTVNQGMGGPQFLRAILSSTEFRLCGAFSQNTTFSYTS